MYISQKSMVFWILKDIGLPYTITGPNCIILHSNIFSVSNIWWGFTIYRIESFLSKYIFQFKIWLCIGVTGWISTLQPPSALIILWFYCSYPIVLPLSIIPSLSIVPPVLCPPSIVHCLTIPFHYPSIVSIVWYCPYLLLSYYLIVLTIHCLY